MYCCLCKAGIADAPCDAEMLRVKLHKFQQKSKQTFLRPSCRSLQRIHTTWMRKPATRDVEKICLERILNLGMPQVINIKANALQRFASKCIQHTGMPQISDVKMNAQNVNLCMNFCIRSPAIKKAWRGSHDRTSEIQILIKVNNVHHPNKMLSHQTHAKSACLATA